LSWAESKNADVLVTLPDNTLVLALGRIGLISSERPRHPDFAVYLDARWQTDPDVTWPVRVIAWPDFGLPKDEADIFEVIANIHARAKAGELVEIACYGGLGRTGTVLSCLAVCAGIQADEAVEWVRSHYDVRAVETDDQRRFIERFENSL